MVLEASRFAKIASMPNVIACSAILTILNKFMFEQYGTGDSIYPIHQFSKPWFQTIIGFGGMALTFIWYDIYRIVKKIKIEEEAIDTNYIPGSEEEKQNRWKFYVKCAIPGFARVMEMGLANICLLFLDASTYQALQCIILVFSILIEAIFGRKRIVLYHWISIIFVVAAICFIYAASLIETNYSKGTITALILIIITQIMKAATYVFEVSLFRKIRTKAALIVGLEGFWGFFFVMAIIVPILHSSTIDPEGNGIHENLWDTLIMLKNNPLWIIPEFFVLGFSVVGVMCSAQVTSQSNPERLPMLEGTAALIVWFVEIILFYSLRGTSYGISHPGVGEPLKGYMILRFIGFALMAIGVIIYGKLIKFAWLYVPLLNKQSGFRKVQDPRADDDGPTI